MLILHEDQQTLQAFIWINLQHYKSKVSSIYLQVHPKKKKREKRKPGKEFTISYSRSKELAFVLSNVESGSWYLTSYFQFHVLTALYKMRK